jgi:CCR4-NOT transcriptional regulation complex NOT5 subunit
VRTVISRERGVSSEQEIKASKSKSPTPREGVRQQSRRKSRDLLGRERRPAALHASKEIKKQVREGSGMVFDGYNWYPKGSVEALITQGKIDANVPAYGPNGSQLESLIAPTSAPAPLSVSATKATTIQKKSKVVNKVPGVPQLDGQLLAARAIAALKAKRGWEGTLMLP